MRNYSSFKLNALWFLIIANILIFIAELLTGGGNAERSPLISLLGLTPAYFLHQPWTIISNLFVHAGFRHIMFNMISLYFLGGFLLRMVGEKDFLRVYFAGKHLIYLAGPFLYPWGGSFRSYLCHGRSLSHNGSEAAGFCFPYTDSHSALGGNHNFTGALLSSQRSMAGSPRRLRPGTGGWLFL